MTKKDLIEFLEDYPDDTKIFCNNDYDDVFIREHWKPGLYDVKAVLISGDYGDD